MKIIITVSILLTLVVSRSPSVSAGDSLASLQAAFDSHCTKCHGKSEESEGEVNLLALKTDDDFLTRPELLEDLINVLKDHEMPPDVEPPLPAAKRHHMISSLQMMLDQAVRSRAFRSTPLRRMNRFQYNNAVVDLLELDRDIFALNERFLRRRDDYFHPETGKMPDQVRVTTRPLAKDNDNERPEGFLGVASFPQDKRAEHGFDNRADHLTLSPLLMESFLQLSQTIVESPDLNFRECRSWDRLFASPGKPVRWTIAGRYEGEAKGEVKYLPPAKGRVRRQIMTFFGNDWSHHLQLYWECPEQGLEFEWVMEVAESGTGLRFGFTKNANYGTYEIFLDGVKIGGEAVDLYHPTNIPTSHAILDLPVSAGPHTLKFKCVSKNDQSTNHFFGLDYVDVTGRNPPPNAEPSEVEVLVVIRSRLAKLLRRAFRRPVDPETLQRFVSFAEDKLASGASFEDTMRTVVGAVLGMPDFLYFYETNDGEQEGHGRQRVSDGELASRLAQFFWSSIPDDTLLELAEQGKLSDSDTLDEQIDRIMNDQRSSRFCDNFPAQWLQLDRLVTAIPDENKFSYFYYSGYRTSVHMLPEPLLLFETIYIENRSITDLLDPKFTWQSAMLKANYEGHRKAAQEVKVHTFRRTSLDDPRRGGVITNAAIMTMTSTPTRTQPISRGAWVNAVIFNDPPEPPPANVPPLPEVDHEGLAKLTIRERLAIHRQRADCAGCHNKIDPLGFALENYGPTAIWRDKYENGREVDVRGVLFNQYGFETLEEFKALLMQEKPRFFRGFVSHLLSYALGRELGPADLPVVEEITKNAVAGNDQLRTILKAVAMSDSFVHKNVQAAP
ncbi:MAG: DUF1588 domain-containing protein [Pirellulaceae bacterium]|nr:DUF1588 domain-containing protein [Pirellulaceae bacterium]